MSEVHTQAAVIESEYKPENYECEVMEVEFTMPSIQLMTVRQHQKSGWFSRLLESTRTRIFTLQKDWKLQIKRCVFKSDLRGTVVIPRREIIDGEERDVTFDGASVPIPWVLSFLTLGIMRPLGVLLTASIVHDYAFKFGHLKVLKEGSLEIHEIPMDRHEADQLFREMIRTINKLPGLAWFAWAGVRLGWLFLVKYNGKFLGGKPPYAVLATLIALVTILSTAILGDSELSFTEVLMDSSSGILMSYFILYAVVGLWMKFFDPARYDTERSE